MGSPPANLGRGYILRRLLRRVVRHGRLLGISKPFLVAMGEAAIALMQAAYPQRGSNASELILAELQREEARFLETLERGEKLLADVLAAKPKPRSVVSRLLSFTTPMASRWSSPKKSPRSTA